MKLEQLQKENPNIEIISINDNRFRPYGKILEGYELEELEEFAKKNIEVPKVGSKYIVSIPEMEKLSVIQKIFADVYAGMEAEAGVCVGQNKALMGIEFHQGSETIIALKDCVLILGKKQDMIDNTYDGALVEYFFVKQGQVIEIYDTTLHYSPCNVDDYFMTIVILLKGTNEPLENAKGMIVKKNKWFITHKTNEVKVKAGSVVGLLGEVNSIK